MRKEAGFTLIEMLVAMALSAILLTLGASALRNYWFVRSLHGAQDQTVTQLRDLQARVVSESHPLVFGLRFAPGQSRYAIVEYRPATTSSPTEKCTETGQSFNSGVVVKSATFSAASGITAFCKGVIPGAATSQFVFFFARGTATEGNLVLEQPQLAGKSVKVTVKPITGRVEAVDL
jgi:prepilin-type N-terminal cleavage/methylation domain-containing protein